MKKNSEVKEYQSAPSKIMVAQLQIIGGGPNEIKKVSTYMEKFVRENDLKIKFIVSNETIDLRSVDWLIAELTKLKEEQ